MSYTFGGVSPAQRDEDLSAQEGPKPIPAGWYDVNLYEANYGESKSAKNAGTPFLLVKFRVNSGKYNDRQVSTVIPLTEEFKWPSYKQGNTLGVPLFETLGIDTTSSFTLPENPTQEWVGEDLQVRVKISKDGSQNDVTAVAKAGTHDTVNFPDTDDSNGDAPDEVISL